MPPTMSMVCACCTPVRCAHTNAKSASTRADCASERIACFPWLAEFAAFRDRRPAPAAAFRRAGCPNLMGYGVLPEWSPIESSCFRLARAWPLASTAPGGLVCGYWRAVSPLGWLSGIGLGRIEECRTLPRRERPKGIQHGFLLEPTVLPQAPREGSRDKRG